MQAGKDFHAIWHGGRWLRLAPLHWDGDEAAILVTQIHVIQAEFCFDKACGNYDSGALAGEHPDLDALADEIAAQVGGSGIRLDLAVLDLRVNQADFAEFRRAWAGIITVQPYRVPDMQQWCVVFGDIEAQHVILVGNGGDAVARQDHGALGHRREQHAPGNRGKHRSLGDPLRQRLPLCDARLQAAVGDIHRRARVIQRGAGDGAGANEGLVAGKIHIGLRQLRAQAGNLGVQRRFLLRQRGVGDQGDGSAGCYRIAVLHRKLHDRAAKPGPGRYHMGAFHGSEYGFLVADLPGGDSEAGGRLRQRQGRAKQRGGTECQQEVPVIQLIYSNGTCCSGAI